VSINFSSLSNCISVDLSGMSFVIKNEHISCLGKVKKLNLTGCCDITDVSCLPEDYDLGLG
jgi:hypothetical protein